VTPTATPPILVCIGLRPAPRNSRVPPVGLRAGEAAAQRPGISLIECVLQCQGPLPQLARTEASRAPNPLLVGQIGATCALNTNAGVRSDRQPCGGAAQARWIGRPSGGESGPAGCRDHARFGSWRFEVVDRSLKALPPVLRWPACGSHRSGAQKATQVICNYIAIENHLQEKPPSTV